MKQKLEIFYILKIKNPLKKRGGQRKNPNYDIRLTLL